MRRKGTITFFVLLLVALGQFAIDIYLPSLPAMVQSLQTNKSAVQLTLTFFFIGFAFSQLVYGPLSERFGRRKILIIGLAIFLVSAVGSIFATTISFLIFLRLIQGLGIGAANVLSRAILRDMYEGKELAKMISYIGILWVSSPIIAPVIGGYIEEYLNWRMNFAFLSIFVGIILIWVLLCLPETKDMSQRHSIHPWSILKNYGTLLSNRSFFGYIFADFFLYGMFSTFYAAGPFLLQKALGLTPSMFGWMMLLISFGYLLGTNINIRLIHRFDRNLIIKMGVFFIFIVTVLMTLLSVFGLFSVSVLVIPLIFLFMGMALVFTNCIGECLSIFPSLAGPASGMWGFLVYLGGTYATSVMSHIPEKNALPFSVSLLIQCFLTFLVLWLGPFRRKAR